jgi:hypothetical protein
MVGDEVLYGLAGTNVYVGTGYKHVGTQYVQQPRTRVEIDLNVRVRGNDTFVGFEDLSGPVAVGEIVEVYESESGVAGEGRVTEIDGDAELVYLSVDWPSIKEERIPSYEVAPTATTELVFVGEITSSFATYYEPWTELITRPCVAEITGSSGAILFTAPIYESPILSSGDPFGLSGSFTVPFADMRQVNGNFGYAGVAA